MDQASQPLTETEDYRRLITARRRLSRPLLVLTIGTYMAFILLIAFQPATLGQPVGAGVISLGIVLGIGLIFLIFLITFYYVYTANRHIEPLIQRMHHLANGAK